MDSSFILLCVDDRPQALELRKATLESHGYRVKTASSGYTAMKMLEATCVSAVILDYKGEGMNAEAIGCHIKQRFPDLPIILLSGHSEIPERVLWFVDEYVMKSELPEGLVRTIERVTGRTNTAAMHKLSPRSSERAGAAA